MRVGCAARALGAPGWNVGRRARNGANRLGSRAATTAAARGRTHRAALLHHAEWDGDDCQAASGGGHAANARAGVAPVRSAGRGGGEVCAGRPRGR
eukprot:6893096-Alexandrium_andersonii.AAC.1